MFHIFFIVSLIVSIVSRTSSSSSTSIGNYSVIAIRVKSKYDPIYKWNPLSKSLAISSCDSVSKFYRESSDGKQILSFTDVYRTTRKFCCSCRQKNPVNVFSIFKDVLKKNEKFDIYMLFIPNRCLPVIHGNTGMAYSGSRLVVDSSNIYSTNFLKVVIVHEIGHSNGLNHAASLNGNEYGDIYSIMGSGPSLELSDFSSVHKTHMGWFSYKNSLFIDNLERCGF